MDFYFRLGSFPAGPVADGEGGPGGKSRGAERSNERATQSGLVAVGLGWSRKGWGGVRLDGVVLFGTTRQDADRVGLRWVRLVLGGVG